MPDTMVMIHGMWVGGWFWNDFKQFFENKGYRCITPTLRYHDADPSAPPHPDLGRTSLLDYVEDLEREIRELGKPPILVGVSMGGLLAQILASRGLAGDCYLYRPMVDNRSVRLNNTIRAHCVVRHESDHSGEEGIRLLSNKEKI